MTTNQRRIALLTGASIAALGIAGPAFAAPRYPAAAPHDAASNGTHAGTNVLVNPSNPVDEIVICEIGAPDPDPCFFGDVKYWRSKPDGQRRQCNLADRHGRDGRS